MTDTIKTLYCSFCTKSQHDIKKLIANSKPTNSNVFICDECVDFCKEILIEEDVRKRLMEEFKQEGLILIHESKLRDAPPPEKLKNKNVIQRFFGKKG